MIGEVKASELAATGSHLAANVAPYLAANSPLEIAAPRKSKKPLAAGEGLLFP